MSPAQPVGNREACPWCDEPPGFYAARCAAPLCPSPCLGEQPIRLARSGPVDGTKSLTLGRYWPVAGGPSQTTRKRTCFRPNSMPLGAGSHFLVLPVQPARGLGSESSMPQVTDTPGFGALPKAGKVLEGCRTLGRAYAAPSLPRLPGYLLLQQLPQEVMS
jgi:hypothetical protein